MKSLQLRSRVAWSAPLVLVLPLLMGADGNGCAPGGPIAVGSGGGADASGSTDGGGSSACTPASCTGLAAPALAKVCPDGTTVSASVCEEQSNGHCGWGFPACPSDACAASDLPCVPCPYGSVGTATDANGCPTCPICAPPPDSGSTGGCPPAPICNLPNCMYGVISQTDANGCDECPVCAPPPDAGTCDCGAPPPVAACPGGGGLPIACEPVSTGKCSWVVGSCPSPTDGGTVCTSDADCASGKVCGFLETSGCGATGTCFPAPMVICNAYSPGCACDGSEVDVICNGLPSGYARKALKHTGACVDGG
ncbi:MAG TPA: hypothetical protein VK762_21475 [Polyangiaceae bacterium]|jgi:hypothetical protein|nr:hypothetical protein [Polyangiaceae bacterium]